jgi:hypothetical protein
MIKRQEKEKKEAKEAKDGKGRTNSKEREAEL